MELVLGVELFLASVCLCQGMASFGWLQHCPALVSLCLHNVPGTLANLVFGFCYSPALRIRIRDPVPFWPWNQDPGSRIAKPYFWKLSDNFLGKKCYNSLKIGSNFFLQHFKNKIIFNFVKFVATKIGMTTIFFHPSLLLLFLDPGSGMGKNQDAGSGINIPNPQHCYSPEIKQKHDMTILHYLSWPSSLFRSDFSPFSSFQLV